MAKSEAINILVNIVNIYFTTIYCEDNFAELCMVYSAQLNVENTLRPIDRLKNDEKYQSFF